MTALSPTAFYPGTFDPVTYGHVDIVSRAQRLFSRVIVGVASNKRKKTLFSLAERIAQTQSALAALSPSVEVIGFDTLLIEAMGKAGASVILRGMRAVSDFEYEFQMAGMNRALAPAVETVFLTASDKYHFVSSRFVREIALMGGDVSVFVCDTVAQALASKIQKDSP